MKAERAILAERLALVAGAVAMAVAVAAVDWRAGLFVAGGLLVASAVDLPRRWRS